MDNKVKCHIIAHYYSHLPNCLSEGNSGAACDTIDIIQGPIRGRKTITIKTIKVHTMRQNPVTQELDKQKEILDTRLEELSLGNFDRFTEAAAKLVKLNQQGVSLDQIISLSRTRF